MNQLIQDSLRNFNVTPPITLLQLLGTLLLSTVLTAFLATVYIRTHSGVSYSKSFVQTIVLFGVTISLIIMLIGSNIARAFALVGALSIIRFRNPVKDPRDVAFLFSSMAIGMACGAKFYAFAVVFALFINLIIVVLHVVGFGELATVVHVLKVRMKSGARDQVEQVCRDMCQRYSVIAIDRLAGGDDFMDVLYEVTLKKRSTYDDFVTRLSQQSQEVSVNLLVGDGNVNV